MFSPLLILALCGLAGLMWRGWRGLLRLWRAIPSRNRDFFLG
ncbi:hypothetical protein [Mitsuaria sp. WAJ17]|nr:hypothetical protein [Mitsuaria sp. WAJ17]